jgi:hypothetical protein
MPPQVRRSIFGIGASSNSLEECSFAFSKMVKTPVGVSNPFFPVEQVDTPIRIPLR